MGSLKTDSEKDFLDMLEDLETIVNRLGNTRWDNQIKSIYQLEMKDKIQEYRRTGSLDSFFALTGHLNRINQVLDEADMNDPELE